MIPGGFWNANCLAGTSHQDGAIGKRPCVLAFVIQLSQLLRQVQDGFSGDHQQLTDSLKVYWLCPWPRRLAFICHVNAAVCLLLSSHQALQCAGLSTEHYLAARTREALDPVQKKFPRSMHS